MTEMAVVLVDDIIIDGQESEAPARRLPYISFAERGGAFSNLYLGIGNGLKATKGPRFTSFGTSRQHITNF